MRDGIFKVYRYLMPIRPRHSHPLRLIRTILGKTQTQFGLLVGVSAITIKRIENGNLALSDSLAARISAATGALQVELLKGSKGKAQGIDGRPYTLEIFQRWNQFWNHASPEQARCRAEELTEFVKLICVASASGPRSNLRSVVTALGSAMNSICRDYGLDARMVGLFEREGVEKRQLPKGGHYFVVNPSLSLLMESIYHRLGKPNPHSVTTEALLQEYKKSSQ